MTQYKHSLSRDLYNISSIQKSSHSYFIEPFKNVINFCIARKANALELCQKMRQNKIFHFYTAARRDGLMATPTIRGTIVIFCISQTRKLSI